MGRAAANPQGLVEPAAAILARVRGVNQQAHFAAPRRRLDSLRAGDQIARPGLESKAIERRLAQGRFDPFGQILGNIERSRLEGPLKRRPQLAFGLRRLERRSIDADPGTPSRGPGTHVRQHFAIRPEGETDQIVPSTMLPGEDALALGDVQIVR